MRYADTVTKVLAGGKTPAGTHRPIMSDEIVEVLAPQPGDIVVDCTLGFGGHALELLRRIIPNGRLIGFDADPIELPKTELRLRNEGFSLDAFTAIHGNFAGLPQALAQSQVNGADGILADLGVSSMQLDDPARGFSTKGNGPLDMRMNPARGYPASAVLARLDAVKLARLFEENADEPDAQRIAAVVAQQSFRTTGELVAAVRTALAGRARDYVELAVRRVFQALRIAVTDEFSALDTLLRHLPACLKPGGRVAILTFHSGEDRRVKKSFEAGLREGVYEAIATEVTRPSAAEQHDNPRSKPAKLRWAKRSDHS